jgi:peptidoglycan/xylan/chitin deacetylase (PgdA/CDA1 family)
MEGRLRPAAKLPAARQGIRRERRAIEFIFTCDDVGAGHDPARVAQFEMVTDWLDRMGIPGTFFWVPRPGGGRPSDQSEAWMPVIRAARERGHDFQLHGHLHECFEFGVPQESIRRHAPQMYEAYDRAPDKFHRDWAVPALRAKFEEAVEIYERAFGTPPLVFRAACLGICDNAYQAMHEAGLRYSSSRSVNPAATGYVITRKPELEAWNPDYSGLPFQEPPGVLEIPCMEDLVIKGIGEDDFGLVLGLFQRDLGHYLDALGDWPCAIFASHYYAIARDMALITRLYETLFEWLADVGVDGWTTFGTVLD